MCFDTRRYYDYINANIDWLLMKLQFDNVEEYMGWEAQHIASR